MVPLLLRDFRRGRRRVGEAEGVLSRGSGSWREVVDEDEEDGEPVWES